MIIISQKGRFCAVCGKTEGPFLENMCEKCYLKEYPIDLSVVKKLEIEICPLCGNIRVYGAHISTWNREETLEEIIREVSRQTIIEKIQTHIPYDYEFDDDIEDSKIFNYGVKEFTIITNILAQPHEKFGFVEKEFKTKLKLLRQGCNECSKFKSGYFEAILQVRGNNRKLTEDEQEYIENLVSKTMQLYEEARMAYILEQEVDQNGFTAKVSTKMLAESLAREIKGQTAGKLSVAFEHKTTAKDGTEVYTNTYLVRLPEFASGDVVEYQNILWIVKNVSDQQISLISLETHEIKKIDRKRVENRAKRRNDEIVAREYMFVSSDGYNAVMMGMDNYENFDDNIERIPPGKDIGETIQGFIYDDKNYYIK